MRAAIIARYERCLFTYNSLSAAIRSGAFKSDQTRTVAAAAQAMTLARTERIARILSRRYGINL